MLSEHVCDGGCLCSDASDQFSSIPKTSPSLGLEAGHSRRDLATARKARPPSLNKGNQQVCLTPYYVPPPSLNRDNQQICLTPYYIPTPSLFCEFLV